MEPVLRFKFEVEKYSFINKTKREYVEIFINTQLPNKLYNLFINNNLNYIDIDAFNDSYELYEICKKSDNFLKETKYCNGRSNIMNEYGFVASSKRYIESYKYCLDSVKIILLAKN